MGSNSNGGTDCRYLCDEALDTEALREALSLRVDGAEEVKKEMREDIAEDKRKLKVSTDSLHQLDLSAFYLQIQQHSIGHHMQAACHPDIFTDS